MCFCCGHSGFLRGPSCFFEKWQNGRWRPLKWRTKYRQSIKVILRNLVQNNCMLPGLLSWKLLYYINFLCFYFEFTSKLFQLFFLFFLQYSDIFDCPIATKVAQRQVNFVCVLCVVIFRSLFQSFEENSLLYCDYSFGCPTLFFHGRLSPVIEPKAFLYHILSMLIYPLSQHNLSCVFVSSIYMPTSSFIIT